MNLIEIMERFPDQEACIAFLERVRWKGKPECSHCQSQKLHRREHETETGRIGRWNCQDCKATFRFKNSLWRLLSSQIERKVSPAINSSVILD